MNKSLVLVMCDVLVLSALSLSMGDLSLSGGKGSVSNGCATNDVTGLSREFEEAKKATKAALAEVQRSAANITSNLFEATNTIRDLTSKLDDTFGTGLASRRERIKTCSYGVYVSYGAEGVTCYSPLIDVGGDVYVVVYLPRNQIKKIKHVKIMQMSGINDWSSIGSCESAWGIDEDEDVIFFRVKSEKRLPTLSLGVLKDESLDHFYWFQGAVAKHAARINASSIEALKQYANIKDGALLISENCTSVIKMAVSRLRFAKGEVSFVGKNKNDFRKLREID